MIIMEHARLVKHCMTGKMENMWSKTDENI